ncbi:MAG: glycosyltransferase family 2 protein [Chthoniobacterales bacterium]
MLISIVLPCYNEAKVLPEIQRRLVELAQKLAKEKFEFIYVDDGSSDETPKLLHEMSEADPRVRGLRLSRNFGQQVAITAGLEHASGDAVVIMDADLQDPPEVIVQMYARWLEGYHVAYGQRQDRAGEKAFKRWSATTFYRVLNRLAPIPIPSETGDFRLLDRDVVRALLQMPERDRFLRGMISWVGFRQVAVPYHRAARLAGETKFSLAMMWRLATDAIFSFSLAPLRIAVWLGLGAIGISLAVIVITIVARLFLDPSRWERGWASLFVAILFLGGVQLVSLGILGEYIGRIYGEVKKRPLYFVRERFGFAEKKSSAQV